mgnify:CR=1 FL=1
MKTEQRTIAEQTPQGAGGVSTRYPWAIKNKPGDFLMVPTKELEVDHAYQRDQINERRVQELSRAWDWVACGCLVVALREDNRWFIVDGQHRKLAAELRGDIPELPCLVFETTGRREEALGFLPTYDVDDQQARLASNGNELRHAPAGRFRVRAPQGLLGVYESRGDVARPVVVFSHAL